jgi:hypothetical protein
VRIALHTRLNKLVTSDKVTNYMLKQLNHVWRICIRAFLEAVAQRIAVDTGMSLASLQPLAAQVQMKTIIIATLRGIGPKAKPGHKNLPPEWSDNIGPFKSRALGARLGTKAFVIKWAPDLCFKFKITVFQHMLHESVLNYIESKNWQSLEAGKEAFIAAWKENIPKRLRASALWTELVE